MTGIDYTLKKGAHDSPEEGLCAMEWVAYLAGEPHSDSPKCVDPPVRAFAISLNDTWDDEQRQKLRPFLVRCIGTAGDGRTEERGWLAMDWLIREFTPAFLALRPELKHHAEKLRSLSPVLAGEALDEAMVLLRAAREDATAAACDAARRATRPAAWDAVGTAARDAVRVAASDASDVASDAAWAAATAAARAAGWAAAWDAAKAVAWDAARDAAWAAAGAAAGNAARDAVWDAAGDAAWDAVWAAAGNAAKAVAWDAVKTVTRGAAEDAAWAALEPTVTRLQVSALDLFDRMIGQGEIVELSPEKAAQYERLLGAPLMEAA